MWLPQMPICNQTCLLNNQFLLRKVISLFCCKNQCNLQAEKLIDQWQRSINLPINVAVIVVSLTNSLISCNMRISLQLQSTWYVYYQTACFFQAHVNCGQLPTSQKNPHYTWIWSTGRRCTLQLLGGFERKISLESLFKLDKHLMWHATSLFKSAPSHPTIWWWIYSNKVPSSWFCFVQKYLQ